MRGPRFQLLCTIIHFCYATGQLGVAGSELLRTVTQLGEFVGEFLSLAADLIERGLQGLPGPRKVSVIAMDAFSASVSCWRTWGVN